jgi:hypothetical protein
MSFDYKNVALYAGKIKLTGAVNSSGPGDGNWFSLWNGTITPPAGELWTGHGFTCIFTLYNDGGSTGNDIGIRFNSEADYEKYGTRNEALTEKKFGAPAVFAASEEAPLRIDIMFQDCDAPGNVGLADIIVIISYDRSIVHPIEEEVS